MLIKYFPLKTLTVQEGDPFGIGCDAPDGWPQPNILWMLEGQNSLKSVNSSRLTVDPAGKLWFSNVTYDDMSDNFLYACSAASYFRNEYKLGNRVHLHVIPSAPRYLCNMYSDSSFRIREAKKGLIFFRILILYLQ